jgi:hypothetical protein
MAWSYVQGTAVDSADHATVTATVGNLMIAALVSQSSANTPTVSDTQGNVWTKFTGAEIHDVAGGFTLTAFWAIAKNSLSTTIQFASDTPTESFMYGEYSGNADSSPADGSHGLDQTDPGTTDGITSGNLTTTVDGDLIVGIEVYLSAADPVAGTGFTARAASSITGVPPFVNTAWEDKVQATHGAIAATWTHTGGSSACMALAGAFTPAAAGGDTLLPQVHV